MKLIANSICGERSGQIIFSDVSFNLGEGDALVISGANGSGKSTLLRIIAGLLKAPSGEIKLEGAAEYEKPCEAMHYLGHQNALKPALSVLENLSFWHSFCGSAGIFPQEALNKIQLPTIGDIPTGFLSAGQKRRVAIARLLVVKKPIWLIDEPTAALDKKSEAEFGVLVDEFLGTGGIVIAATHKPLGMKKFMTLDMQEVCQAKGTETASEVWL